MLNLSEFLAAEDTNSGGGVAELTTSETIDFLGDDDEAEETIELEDKTPIKPKKEDKDEDDEDDEKEEKIEVDDDDDDEVDEDDLEIKVAPRRKEILAKYPNLFKDFPYLATAYYREQQFTEVFSDVSDAKEALTKSETLDAFESDLLSGNTEKILTQVRNADKEAFNKIADDYLGTLARVDKDAYYHVLGNEVKNIITAMVRESRNNNNEALQSAAAVLNQFIFGVSDFTPPQKLAKQEDNSKVDELAKRERAIVERQFVQSRDSLSSRVDNVLKTTISANIDPKDSMTEYVKKNAIKDAHSQVVDLISQDSRFKSILDKLWGQAVKDNFSKNSLDKIKSAYLSKAKTLLPTVIKQARNEALKGLGKRVVKEDSDESETKETKNIPVGRAASSHNSSQSPKESASKIPAGMSSRDYLMQD